MTTPVQGASPRLRVLVVDDEPMLGKSVRRMIERQHDCTVVASGADALAQLSAGTHFDAVLCDLMMPRMTGMELYTRVLQLNAPLAARFVFMSGDLSIDGAVAFFQANGCPRLDKPFTRDELLTALARFEALPT